jgi:Phosphopantetheine attachment site.
VSDNFFEMGGDSIQILKVVSEARNKRIIVRAAEVFANQTVEALAKVARLEPAEHTDPSTLLLRRGP